MRPDTIIVQPLGHIPTFLNWKVCGCVSQPEIVSSNAPVLNIVELALTNT